MTEERIEQANKVFKDIQDIKRVLHSIEKKIKIIDNKPEGSYHPYLRFLNMTRHKNGKETSEATVLLFDGVSNHGTEVLVDERLLNCIKEDYLERLKEAKAELDAL